MVKLTNYNIATCAIVGIGGFTYGFGFAVFITSLGQPGFYKYFNLDPNSNHTASVLGAVNALFSAGAAFGALTQGYLADKIGRKKALTVSALCSLVGGALVAGSVAIGMLITVRLIQGFGLGLCLTLVSLYLSEVAPASRRGLLTSMTVCSLGAGYLVSFLIAVGTYYSTDENVQWRVPLAMSCIGPLALFLGLFFVPESPRYLAWVGKDDEAWKVIRQLHQDPNDPTEAGAHAEHTQITRQVAHDRTLDSSYKSIFAKPSWRKRALLAMFLGFASQWTGVNGITNFLVPIFRSLGVSGVLPLVLLCGYSICGNTAAWMSALMMDRFGRKAMLMFGFIVIAAMLLIQSLLQRSYVGTNNKAGNIACLVFIYLFIMSYQIVDSAVFVWSAEVFPTTLRAKGIGLTFFAYFVGAITWTTPAGVAFQNIKWGMYLLWMGLCLCTSAIVYFYVPETTRMPMEEIAALFGDTVVIHLVDDGHAAVEDKEFAVHLEVGDPGKCSQVDLEKMNSGT